MDLQQKRMRIQIAFSCLSIRFSGRLLKCHNGFALSKKQQGVSLPTELRAVSRAFLQKMVLAQTAKIISKFPWVRKDSAMFTRA